jgi:starch synthase (maltosyl-transferring)
LMQTISPVMHPVPGDRLQRFVGDQLLFTLRNRDDAPLPEGCRARLRTNLGRAELLRREILQAHARGLPIAGGGWRDLPMEREAEGWRLQVPLAEVGYFQAKAYLLDSRSWQHWPEGPNVSIAVHPNSYRTGNILYCAFTRMFSQTRRSGPGESAPTQAIAALDAAGYTVIPPSGKFRDLVARIPHIFNTLGCRILHLLPVNPSPTTYARFGRFGSPYAALDLKAVDPALVEFDQRTTGIDQFRELTYSVHLAGGRVFLDIVINHTGWGSVLQENRPEWFLRHADGRFASPGAWGVTWEDLIELKHHNIALWDELAEVFLTWCRRGVDGFRCDAGYKVPVAAWQYIVTRVQQEYPETIFFLEGLGGAWDVTEALLGEGGMQWAYSELFQNYSPLQVSGYLDHSLRQSHRTGVLVNYSETHDNERLASKSRAWSLLRNRLCALSSVSGAFGFTCGVEWLAREKIQVHGSADMAWSNPENLIPELARLDGLLTENPCFYDGAQLCRLSAADSPILVLLRISQESKDAVLVLVNLDDGRPATLTLDTRVKGATAALNSLGLKPWVDLLGQTVPQIHQAGDGNVRCTLAPGAAYCLAPTSVPLGLSGQAYRRARAQAAWGIQAVGRVLPVARTGEFDWRTLASSVDASPEHFLTAVSRLKQKDPGHVLLNILQGVESDEAFPCVTLWTLADTRRVTLVPPDHWLLLRDNAPFRAQLKIEDGSPAQNLESFEARDGHYAAFAPGQPASDAMLYLERYAASPRSAEAAIRFLAPAPAVVTRQSSATDLVLLTNGRGGMARICVDLGRVLSKYDCVLGANLHPHLPVDRHILVKRIRVWVNADGFISPLDFSNLGSFESGPPALWHFVANAGDGRTVEIQMSATMLEGKNTTVFHFTRPSAKEASGKQLPEEAEVRLTARLDIEDRNFHTQTKHEGGADYHFSVHTFPLEQAGGAPGTFRGFGFKPDAGRHLRAYADAGRYYPQPEWSENIPHPVEQSRGQVPCGDAYSPGWFELPLRRGDTVSLVATAEDSDPGPDQLADVQTLFRPSRSSATGVKAAAPGGQFTQALLHALRAFVVRRGEGVTVIAGYPWFLDWGRDTLICARGLITAGMLNEVERLLVTFARFEKDGTLPNTIFGEDASNRDTSDAPLWFAVATADLAHTHARAGGSSSSVYTRKIDESGRTILLVLESIARNYLAGTPNGIRMDPTSGLIWSPSHFTWMDTNYPAGTPREGYPVEIQALWIALLRQLGTVLSPEEREPWLALARKATASFEQLFWRETLGWYADVLLAPRGHPAAGATVDDALRCNCLLPVSFGLAAGTRARRCVQAAVRYLLVPGALRSLAPLPVSVPLPIYGNDGRLLNNPKEPYWGHYQGDEDYRRKPAYHNGTGWTWMLPVCCEALARAWDFEPAAVAAAGAFLGSLDRLMREGCLGHIPENVDGDAPHTQRGCDAQAWSVSEALRVWKLLERHGLARASE